MKKTKLTRSLMAACSIVALSAVMYGCVHNGGDGPVATDVTLSGAQMGQTLEAGTYQPDADLTAAIEGASEADLEAAGGEHATDDMITLAGLDFSCVSGPCSVTVNDDGTVTTMGTIMVMARESTTDPVVTDPIIAERAAIASTIAAANTAVAAVGDAATDAQVAAANAAVTAARTAISDAGNVPAPERAANTGTVNAIATTLSNALTSRTAAIDVAEKAQAAAGLVDATSLLGAFNRVAEVNVPAITSVSASSGGVFKVTPTTASVFEPAAAPDTVAGHHGAMLTHDDEAMVVYSSIANAEAKAVGGVFDESDPPGSNEFLVTTDGAASTIPITALMVATEFVVTRDTTAGMATFPGSVNGAMGTFSCTFTDNAGCAAPAQADGEISGLNNVAWTFTPNAGARTDVADTDYVYFGWWLKKATGDWQVATFTGAKGYGTAEDATATVVRGGTALAGETLTGSATYEGAAAGKFTTVGNGSGEAGHFVADAMLMVNFDADNDDATAGNDEAGVTLSGMIDEFVANGTSRDWTVALTRSGGVPAMTLGGIEMIDENNEETVATWKSGDVTMGTGDWTADFYGTEEGTTHPMAATGEFSASVGDANIGNHIAGAFGVEKE